MKQIIFSIFIALVSFSAMGQTLSVQPIEAKAGEQATLTVSLSGATAMTALQFNLALPEGVTLAGNEATQGAATNGHTLDVETLDNGDHLFILYSMDLNTFKDGELLRIPVIIGSNAKSGEGSLYTVRFSTTEAVSSEGSNAQFNVTVKDPEPEGFSNNKLYTLTCKRGGLVMNAEGTGLAAGQTRTDAPEADKRFAIITYNGEFYLYSPTVKQYLIADGSFVSRLGSSITFDDSKADGEYKYMLSTQGTNGETWYFNNNGNIVINNWDAADDGNRWLIEPVADFDPTEALAMAAAQSFTVTYEVLYEGKVVATATEKVASGNALPAPPASLKNDYITLSKSGTHPTKVTKDVTVQFTAKWNGPFEFSKNVTNAKWYNMHIRSGWYVGKQESEPYYPKQNDGKITQTAEYLWAFGGDPYHVKVYNYTTGFAEMLTKDGENAVMRQGEYAWDLLSNNGGFVLRETGTDYNCINQLGGGGGPLGFWYDGWSPTDDGSTFRVEEAMDVVDGIESLTPTLSKGEGEIYDLSGRKMSNGRRKGIYIIRMKDGTTKKTMIK